jgi:hypothetical protein
MATSPRSQSSVKVAPVHQHDAGTVCALSSDGHTRYVVRLGDAPSCTCKGFQHHGHCYHLDTALARFGAFYTAPWAVIGAAAEPEPEPPSPAAPAHSGNCLLYTDPACPACRARRAA